MMRGSAIADAGAAATGPGVPLPPLRERGLRGTGEPESAAGGSWERDWRPGVVPPR
jgi:hypothetical protein